MYKVTVLRQERIPRVRVRVMVRILYSVVENYDLLLVRHLQFERYYLHFEDSFEVLKSLAMCVVQERESEREREWGG